MARQNKGSRSKFLPPRIQLQQRDATTGSYPSLHRTSCDNRSGKYNTFFDDTKVVNFVSLPGNIRTVVSSTHTTGFDANENYQNLLANYTAGPNLISWWRMETSSSAIVPDSKNGNPLPLTIVSGGVLTSSTVPSYYLTGSTFGNLKSLHLSASGGQYAIAPTSSQTCFITGGFTISAHINLKQLFMENSPIVWKPSQVDPTTSQYFFVIKDTGQIQFIIADDPTGGNIIFYTQAVGLINTGSWYHLLFTWNGVVSGVSGTPNGAKIYINGVSQSIDSENTDWPGFSTTSTRPLYINRLIDTDFFGSEIYSSSLYVDNVSLHNRYLSEDEVGLLYIGGPRSQSFDFPSNGLSLPTGLPSGSSFLNDATGQPDSELTTNMHSTGMVRKGVGDTFVHFTPGQDLTPFRDDTRPESDNKGSYTSSSFEFYATGSKVSDVGEGFDQPLWSKTKIEIDLTPSQEHSFFIHSASNSNNVMAYWNKNTRKYEGIGPGTGFLHYSGTSSGVLQRFLNEVPIGFGASQGGTIEAGLSNAAFMIGAPITNFGFPIHPKFHGTSSNLISMSDYISEPFLLEKIVVYFSGAMDLHYMAGDPSLARTCMTTMFILNQKKLGSITSDQSNQIITFLSGAYSAPNSGAITFTTTTGTTIPTIYNGNYISSVRDLIGWIQISEITGDGDEEFNKGITREIITETANWSMQFIASSSARSPVERPSGLPILISGSATGDTNYAPEYFEKYNISGRLGIPQINGRDYINSFSSFEFSAVGEVITARQFTLPINCSRKSSKTNPYLLMPNDNLIVGWQLPISKHGIVTGYDGGEILIGKGPELTISPNGIHKIIFYGSHIKEGREHHDTTNQLLTSPAIHEVIE